jgi:hypothetical protein
VSRHGDWFELARSRVRLAFVALDLILVQLLAAPRCRVLCVHLVSVPRTQSLMQGLLLTPSITHDRRLRRPLAAIEKHVSSAAAAHNLATGYVCSKLLWCAKSAAARFRINGLTRVSGPRLDGTKNGYK